MEFYRVGDKLVSKDKLMRSIDHILNMRSAGMSQQEVAQKVGCDRTFISRLEALAEVRKGGSLALIAFPIANKDELVKTAEEMGVDYSFVMTDQERWTFVESLSGLELLNSLMDIITKLRDFDNVIMMGSDMRVKLAEAILGDKVIGVKLGESPIAGDVEYPAEKLRNLISTLRGSSR